MNADPNTDMNSDMDMDMDMDPKCSVVSTNTPMPQDDGALTFQFVCMRVLVFS